MAKSSYKGITVDITFQGNTSKFNEAVTQIDKNLKTVDSELKEVNKDLKPDPSNVTLLSQKFDLLGQRIKETSEKLKLMRDAQKEIEAAYLRGEIDGGAYRDFQRELGKTEAQMKSLKAEASQTAEAVAGRLKSAVSDLGNEMKIAVDIIKKAELALIAFSAASAKVGANFESAMSQVAATLQIQAGTEEYEKLSAAAKEMGESTSYSAAQAASALNSLAQAGYTADESIERLPKTLALAKAGGLDLGSAAKIVTQSMASLQLSESDLDKLLDEMARTAQKSNTNIAELGEAIKGVGGTMNMAGQSVETMLTELGMLANAGVAASEAGTHLRNVMLALVKTDVQKSLHDMGVEVTDSTGAIRDLSEIMTELAEATDGMTSGDKLTLFGDLFNVRDLASVNALLNGTKGSMQALRAEIENSQGAASQMAETMGDNLTGDITILKSAFEGLQIAISEKLNPSLRTAAKNSTEFIGQMSDSVKSGELAKSFEKLGNSISKLITSGLNTGAKVLPTIIDLLTVVAEHFDDILAIYLAMQAYAKTKAIVTAIGETVVSVVNLTKAIKTAQTAQEAFNAASAANPIGAIATAAAAVVAGLTFAITKAAAAIDVLGGETAQASKEVQEYAENIHKLTAEVRETNDAREKSLNDIDRENARLSTLAGTIGELADKQEKTAADYETLHSYIAKLNEAVPSLNLAFDDQTNTLNMTRDAMKQLVDSYEAYQELQARIDYGADLKREQVELQDAFDDTSKKLDKSYQDVKRLRDKYTRDKNARDSIADRLGNDADLMMQSPVYLKAQKQFIETSNLLEAAKEDWHELGEAHLAARTSLEEVNEKLDNNNAAIDKCTETAEGYTEATDDSTDANNKNKKSLEDAAKAYDAAKTATAGYKSELKDLLGVLDNVQKGTAYSTSQILDLIEKYPQLTAAIHETAEGYTIEADAIRALTKAKADDLVASVQRELAETKAQMSKLAGGAYDIDPEMIARRKQLEQQLAMYQSVADDIASGRIYTGGSSSPGSGGSSYSSGSNEDDPYSEMLKERKAQAKSEQAELENLYKTEKISAEDYYNGLKDIAQRYYGDIGDLREEYLSAENKAYEGLKKAQEEELSTAKKLEDQLTAIKDAEDALRNAQSQQVQVYSGAAGFRTEQNTAAIEKAQQSLADKNYSLAETLLKNARFDGRSLTDRLQSIGLAQIRDMLPDLSGITLPSIGGGTTTQTTSSTRSVTYNGGDINITIQGSVDETTMPTLKTSIEDAVRKGIEAFLDEENAASQTGGI